jgi:hypothetical protein
LGSHQSALGTLDAYNRRFPDGSLAREALLARIDVLTSLGKGEAAREAISSALDKYPSETDRLLPVRARLSFQSGDCEAGEADISQLQSRGSPVEGLLSFRKTCR